MNLKIRLKAFAVHLLISAAVVGAALGLTYGVWYQGAFASIENVSMVTLLLVGVDLVMGPILTLVVYNPAKKSLKFDLAVIGVVQLAALIYGMSAVYQARPVYAVYHAGRFLSSTASSFKAAELAKAGADSPYLPLPRLAPRWVGAKVPPSMSENERNDLFIADMLGGGPRIMPRLYVPYATVAAEAVREGKRADSIDYVHPAAPVKGNKMPPPTRESLSRLSAELERFGLPFNQLVMVPLHGSARWAIVALRASDGQVLGTIDMQPFWF